MHRSKHAAVLGLAVMTWALVCGCGPPISFEIETAVHADGSCDRMIWQPKGAFLPKDALTPEWNARWQFVGEADAPGASRGQSKKNPYFISRGTFASPSDIPEHYQFFDEENPDLGVSDIQREYVRKDYGFVVEHRWTERITNVVDLPRFVSAVDEGVDFLLPRMIKRIEEAYRARFDVTGLTAYMRANAKPAAREYCMTLYDLAVRRRLFDESGKPGADVERQLALVSRKYGLELFDEHGKVVRDEEAKRRVVAFERRLLKEHVRRRDQSALSDEDVETILGGKGGVPSFDSLMSETAVDPDADAKKGIRYFVGVFGLYHPLRFFLQPAPSYEFTLRLPGALIETNGRILEANKTRWRFNSDQLFPTGFEMTARSLAIDLNRQKERLGRVAIENAEVAQEYVELLSVEGSLPDAVRKLWETGDAGPLRGFRKATPDELRRAKRLRRLLLGE